jgi:hypothetical protein
MLKPIAHMNQSLPVTANGGDSRTISVSATRRKIEPALRFRAPRDL